jgi:ribosome-associated translation inhibitor RaiA
MPKKNLQEQIEKKLDQLQKLLDQIEEVRIINSDDSDT